MTYTVEKIAPGHWQVMQFAHSRMIGIRVGSFSSRDAAMDYAKLLAGRYGVVHLYERTMKHA